VIYGKPPYLKAGKEIDMINTHNGAIVQLKKRYDSGILVSVGSDGVVFVYRVTDAPNKNIGRISRKQEY
jgi:hypothetical protein